MIDDQKLEEIKKGVHEAAMETAKAAWDAAGGDGAPVTASGWMTAMMIADVAAETAAAVIKALQDDNAA